MFPLATSIATRLYRSALSAVLREEKLPDTSQAPVDEPAARVADRDRGAVGPVGLRPVSEGHQGLPGRAVAGRDQLTVRVRQRDHLVGRRGEGLVVVEHDAAPRLVERLG